MKPNNPNDKILPINDDSRGRNSGMSNKESTSEPSPSRLKAAAQSFARATVSFFRALPNFSQYLKDRYEFGPRIASVLWRAKDAHAKDPEKAIIPHVEDTLNESKEGNSALSKAVWNVLSDKLGDGQGGIKPGLSDDDVIERGGKITLDDLRENLREIKPKDGFETNTAKVHPANEPDNEGDSFESKHDSAYSDWRSSTNSDRRSRLSELSHQAAEDQNVAKKTQEGFLEPDPTNEDSRSESDLTDGPKPD